MRKRTVQQQARGPRPSKFPAHLRMQTPEEWRALKRTEWREVTQALERYAYGCGYTPANAALYHLKKLAQQITEAIESPDWIAW